MESEYYVVSLEVNPSSPFPIIAERKVLGAPVVIPTGLIVVKSRPVGGTRVYKTADRKR